MDVSLRMIVLTGGQISCLPELSVLLVVLEGAQKYKSCPCYYAAFEVHDIETNFKQVLPICRRWLDVLFVLSSEKWITMKTYM